MNKLSESKESNSFKMNDNLLFHNKSLESNKNNEDIIFKESKTNIKEKDLKINIDYEIKYFKEKKNPGINELYEQKKSDADLLFKFKNVLEKKTIDKSYLGTISDNISDIINNNINDFITIDFHYFNFQNEENKINKIKNFYLHFFQDIKEIIIKNNNLYRNFIEKFLLEKSMKGKFEYLFIEGIIINKYPLFSEQIADLYLSLIRESNKLKDIQKDFYINICQIFFNPKNHVKLNKIISDILNPSKLLVDSDINPLILSCARIP